MSATSARTRVLVGAVVSTAIVAGGVLVSPSSALAGLASLRADPLLFGTAVAALYLVRPLFAWPTTPLAVVVGYGFGIALGIPIALAGVVATVIPVFLAVRWWVGDEPSAEAVSARGPVGSLRSRSGRAVRRYYETAGPLRGVTASRLAPIPSDATTAAAAIHGVRLRHLVVGTAVGELPWTTAAVVVGASAGTVTTDGLGDLGLALSVGCALAAALLLSGPLYRALRPRTSTGDAGGPAEG